MSKTFKHKLRHIIYRNDEINLRVPLKLRWSYINKIRRRILDYAIDRHEWVSKKDKESKIDMKNQFKAYESKV